MPRFALIAAVTLALTATAIAEDGLSAGPMLGAATHESVTVWARGQRAGEALSVRVRPASPDDAPWRELEPVTFGVDRDLTAVVRITGLQPSTDYRYEARVGEASAGEHSFRTLPVPGTGTVRLAFGSCVKVGYAPKQPIFAAIARAKPDVFIWQGDNCYYSDADVRSRQRMFARMRQARSLPSLRELLAGTSNVAQWDDHDFGPNDSDSTYPLKRESRRVFTSYWPNPSAGEDGEGIYTRLSLGPIDLFLLDNRWFRVPNHYEDGPKKTILGERQRAWLIAGLAASKAPIKVVAAGGQFLARYHRFESWDTARHERSAILKAIKEKGIAGVLFISGDRHLAEANRWDAKHVGYELWDITSSPLSNRFWPDGAKAPNPDRVFSYGDSSNFGWIEVDAQAKTVKLELRDEAGKTLWSYAPKDLWPGRG